VDSDGPALLPRSRAPCCASRTTSLPTSSPPGSGARMFSRWQGELSRQGFDASEEHGWDVRKVQLGDGDLANYFTKVAREVTGSHRKEGRAPGAAVRCRFSRTPSTPYEERQPGALVGVASEGRRQLTWSTGRRSLRRPRRPRNRSDRR